MFFLQMSGFPGSGKSTLANEIQKKFNCIIIDHDISKTAILENEASSQLSAKQIGSLSYDLDFANARFYLNHGYSVILDSPCLYDEVIEKGMQAAHDFDATYKYIECVVKDFFAVNDRLQTRQTLPSQIRSIDSEEHFIRTLQSSKYPVGVEYLKLDTLHPLETYLDEVMAYMNRVELSGE